MILVVAEKKSVAHEIAASIGSRITYQHDRIVTNFEGADLVIGFPNGHAVRSLYPDEMNVRYKKWALQDLPICPEEFQFESIPASDNGKACLDLVGTLAPKAREIINACDAGREGELIFREIMEFNKLDPYGPKVRRMWITDTTKQGLQKAFANRSRADCKKYRCLGLSAEVRKHADWIYGINGTRYYEISKRGWREGRSVIGIGRVKTPLLDAINQQCEKLKQWEPKPYYQAYANFRTDGESYEAMVLAPENMQFGFSDHSFRDDGPMHRYLRKMETTVGLIWEVQDKMEYVDENYYGPYNLNDLIRSAARILQWNSEYTMQIAQNLYEKDKSISYPRTESNYFPESMESEIAQKLDWVLSHYLIPNYPHLEKIDIQYGETGRWLSDSKSEDHHAIIPIGTPEILDDFGGLRDEYKLWELISKRFFLAFQKPALICAFSRLSIATHYDHTTFRTLLKSAHIAEAGYLEVHEIIGGTEYRNEFTLSTRRERNPLPTPVKEAKVINYRHKRRLTPKPDLFNDDTILSYMEVNKLGTAATRVSMIRELRESGAIDRDYQNFYYTTKTGVEMIDHIKARDVKELLDVELTKTWEEQLEKVESGARSAIPPKVFLTGVREKIRELGLRLNSDGYVEEVVICPKSGLPVDYGSTGYIFPGWPDMEFPYEYRARNMAGTEWKQVIQNGAKGGGPFTFKSFKTGVDYQAFLVFKRRQKKIEIKFKRQKRA